MLERTTGCLETGSLRRLLPASRKSLKSRRTLHSGFWSHAAGDIEFSPLWAALVRATDPFDQQGETLVQQKTSNGNGGMLLDFLYPAGTINFLPQCSGWGFDRQEGRFGRLGLGKLGYRQYTSSAKDSNMHRTTESKVGNNGPNIIVKEDDLEQLREIMGIKRNNDFEEVWRQYLLLSGDDQAQLRKQVIQYLSKSERVVDAERTTELFEALDEGQRTPMAHRSTIRSFLRLRNLADAMELHKSALENLEYPAGSDELLAYLIDNSFWSRALSIWDEIQHFKKWDPERSYDIYAAVDTLPGLGMRALELADYVKQKTKTSPSADAGQPTGLVLFASAIVHRAMMNYASFDQSRFIILLETMQEWGFDTPGLYEEAVHMLLYLKHTKLAVKCYRNARQRERAQFTQKMLHSMLKVFCSNHSVIGMQQVLDDFFRFYSKPSRIAYKMCMVEFSRQGDAETVRALFDQYTGRFVFKSGLPLLVADDIVPLLHVHAKRGEINEVVRLFKQIQDNYGLQPTLACWNVLINAYGKAHDTDSAYECFEQLLYSEHLQPDDYTFGTIMSICVSRGDLQRALEVYKLSEDLGIDKSSVMMDCLILGHLQHDQLEQAEKICEGALKIPLKGSRTRMWNYLLIAHAMRRDLNNVNRLLRRMSDAKIEYDQYTYSALMQALAVAKQPDRAYAILQDVMPEAGIKPTSFHYAIVMGGYIANGETRKVFHVQNKMIRRKVRQTASSNLLTLKARAAEDQKLLEEGTDEQHFQRAIQIFENATSSVNLQDISDPARKGAGRLPLDITYSTMFYSFIIFVLGQNHDFEKVDKLYGEFQKTLPESKSGGPPIQMLSALMISKFNAKDYAGVQGCWDLALSQTKEYGRPPLHSAISVKDEKVSHVGSFTNTDDSQVNRQGHTVPKDIPQISSPLKIVPSHQLDLVKPLTTYMRTLDIQYRMEDLKYTVNTLLDNGFVLDNDNWNLYITILARRFKYRQAFDLCETKLMDGWTGWARIRWQLPERNRLPMEVRNLKRQPKHLRPKLYTFHALARAFLELQSMAAESRASQVLLNDLEHYCPRTLQAIKTMQRTDDTIERQALHGY